MGIINARIAGITFEDYMFNAIAAIMHETDFLDKIKTGGQVEPNLVNVISMTRGRSFLEPKESMEIGYDNTRYVIIRLD